MQYLSDDEGRTLLEIARESLRKATDGERLDERRIESAFPVTDRLREPRGIFVTLRLGKVLRGCIGLVQARRPLYAGAAEYALAAGMKDPRFEPLTPEELDRCAIEVSVLTPLNEVHDIRSIDPARHGIRLTKGRSEAVFLPSVARERGWGVEVTLSELALKAGLGADAWKSGATLHTFECQEFEEGE